MISKISIRNEIKNHKELYRNTNDKDELLYVALLKALYLADGGKKGIALNSEYDPVTYRSLVVFKYMITLDNNYRMDKVTYRHIHDILMKIGKSPNYYLNSRISKSNTTIAKLISFVVCYDYNENRLINKDKIYEIALNILNKNREEEAET